MISQILLFPSRAAALQATPFFVEEPGRGCWVQTDDISVPAQGTPRHSERYALHIPSQTQTHTPLPQEQIREFEAAARAIGLKHISPATGFWTLENGLLQEEALLIAWSEEPVAPEALRSLARRVLIESCQEAVAIEVAGKVEIIRTTLENGQ